MKNRDDVRGLRRYLVSEAGFNISWASIFAGVVTFFAILAVLSLIGSAIGFEVVEPTSNDPFDGVGIGVLIWTIITLVLSFMAAGFIAGMASRRLGVLHGFLTWATSVLLLIVMLTVISASAITGAGKLIGSAFSLVGDGASTVGSGLEVVVEKGIETANENLEEINTDELQVQISEVLQDTDTPELQPEYLNNQLKEVGSEITEAGKELLTNPDNSDEIINNLVNSLQERAQTIGDAVDRDAIASSVAANTDLSEAEAEEATDNIYMGLEKASNEAQVQINIAAKNIEEAQVQIEESIQKARVEAEKAAHATAKASIWSFLGLVIAMIVTTISGIWGSNFVQTHNEETM